MPMLSCFCHIEDCLLCEAKLSAVLDGSQVCDIRGLLNHHEYQPHQILFREGDPSGSIHIVREGQLKLTTTDSDGNEQIIGIGLNGHMVGFYNIDEDHYSYTAEALTPVKTCQIKHKNMLRVLAENPVVSNRMISLLNDELSQAQLLIRLLGKKTSHEKVALFILSLLPETHDTNSINLLFPLSRRELAQLLGLTIETVSRTMSDMKRKNILNAPRGKVEILDIEQLKSFAGQAVHDLNSLKNNNTSRALK